MNTGTLEQQGTNSFMMKLNTKSITNNTLNIQQHTEQEHTFEHH